VDSIPQRKPSSYFAPFIGTSNTTSTTNISDLDTITASSLTTDSNIPRIFSNLNSMNYDRQADDTDYTVSSIWTPPASGHLVKFTICIAGILNLTTRSSDDITFTGMQIRLREVGTNNTLWSQTYETNFAAQDAAGEVRMFIAKETIANQSIEVQEGVQLNITVTLINTGDTANITWDTGVVPLFPLTVSTDSKFLYESGIVFYIDRTRLSHEPQTEANY